MQLYYFRIRRVLGDDTPSEITLYMLRSNCTNFGALIHSVMIYPKN